jgi:hypothetical protein
MSEDTEQTRDGAPVVTGMAAVSNVTALGGGVYPTKVPEELPSGRFLVHNEVRPDPRMRQGWRGSRYWLQALDDTLEPCDCG